MKTNLLIVEVRTVKWCANFCVTFVLYAKKVMQPPNDSISSLCFSPKANFLVATSWDNQVF